jgi:hypothetical protein
MFFMPYSPRWLVEKGKDEKAVSTLAYLRSLSSDHPAVQYEFLEIKAEVMALREMRSARLVGEGRWSRFIQPYKELVSTKANFKRLFIGSVTMFYQQFIGCNAIIYYAPTSKSSPWGYESQRRC